ncbi:MAG: hypothetical protein ACI30H_07940 [Paludibacteraceae bacterium]
MNKTNLFKALLLALVGGTIAFTACDKENEPVINPPHNGDKDTTTVIPPEPHYNVELFFNNENAKQIDLDTIKKYDANTRVDTIFMIPDDENGVGGAFSGLGTNALTQIRNFLQKRVDASPKVRGKGDLLFVVGEALPADSLWFVQQGWTVNQSRNNQR